MSIKCDGSSLAYDRWKDAYTRVRSANGYRAFVDKDTGAIEEMSLGQFRKFCDSRVVSKMRALPWVNDELSRNVFRRNVSRLSLQTYVCTGVSLHGAPSCHMVSARDARGMDPSLYLSGGRVVLKPEVMASYEQMPKEPFLSREDLDCFVRHLASDYEIPWEHTEDGCLSRAHMAVDFLKLSGIPASHMQLQYHCFPSDTAKIHPWRYHVAVRVRLKSGLIAIVDPALEPKRALDLEEWTEKQTTAPFMDEGVQKKGSCFSFGERYDQSYACVFQCPIDFGGITIDSKRREVRVVSVMDSEMGAECARHRSKLEKVWWAAGAVRD